MWGDAVRAYTGSHGVAAVFLTRSALRLTRPACNSSHRDCLINYGELPSPVPPINLHQLFLAPVFVTKYKGMRWVEGFHEFAGLIADALALAAKSPSVISDIVGRFPLDRVADAYRLLESGAHDKVLVAHFTDVVARAIAFVPVCGPVNAHNRPISASLRVRVQLLPALPNQHRRHNLWIQIVASSSTFRSRRKEFIVAPCVPRRC
jgi:hypothetical protein